MNGLLVEALNRIFEGDGDLGYEFARKAFASLLDTEGSPELIAAFLVALHFRGESDSEFLAALDAVRRAVGDDMHLMVDFNQGLTLSEALQRCHLIDDHGLAWIEEPIVYDNIDGYAQLAQELRTPLQIGENFYGPREMHKALQRKACDLVMPDFMRIGGVTGWLRAAAIAGAAGVPVSTHLYPEVAAHVMRVTETAHWLEWQDWADPILEEPFKVEGGNLVIPGRPGVGLRWNEAAVKRYRYEA